MNIDFLAITSIIVASRYFIAFLALSAFLWFGYGAYLNGRKEIEANGKVSGGLIIKTILSFAAIFFVVAFVFSGVASPKGVIDIPYKAPELVENIEIVTPPPRTETLNGFEPLKKD